jgi:hypothetical protein
MHRTFISTIVAAALTITGISSTMAQAGEYRYAGQQQRRSTGGNEAVAGALAGIAALFIISKAIENNGGFKKKSHRPKQHVQKSHRNNHKRASNGHRRNDGHRSHRNRNNHRQDGHGVRRSHDGHRMNNWNRHNNGDGHARNHNRGRN